MDKQRPARLHDVVLVADRKSAFCGQYAEVIELLPEGGVRVKGANIDVITGEIKVFTLDLSKGGFEIDRGLTEKLKTKTL